MEDKIQFRNDHFEDHVTKYLEDPTFLEIAGDIAKENGWSKTTWMASVKKRAREIQKERKEQEKRKAEEAAQARVQEMEDAEGVKVFDRGDYAELAAELCDEIARENAGEAPAFHADMLWRYIDEAGLWRPISDKDLSCKVQGWAGLSYIRVDTPSGEKLKALRFNDTDKIVKMAKAKPNAYGRGEVGDRRTKETWLSGGDRGIAFSNYFVVAESDGAKLSIQFRQNDPDNRATFGYSFAFQTGATQGGAFEEFLHEIFDGAPDKLDRIECLQQYCGACLMGIAPKMNKALLLHGPPGTGKGTLLSIIASLMPDGACSVQPKDWDDPQMLAELAGRRLNVINELSYDDLSDANAVKRIVSGDLVTAKVVYSPPFSFSPECGHIITANEDQLPSVRNADQAFWDRWLAIPVENRFRDSTKEKRGIVESMTGAEAERAVSWMVHGAMQLTDAGRFTTAETGEAVIDQWRGVANNPTRFISEALVPMHEVEPDAATRDGMTADEIYPFYRAWCSESGYRAANKGTLTQALRASGYYVRVNGSRFTVRVTAKVRSWHDEAESRTRFGR